MRTVPLKLIFQGVSSLLGAELVTISSPDFVGIMAAINTWVETGWKYDFWPEWSPTERRAYRDAWSAGTTYTAGNEIFFATDSLYYSANSAPNTPTAGQSPATHPTKWTLMTSFARYVPLEQTGKTPIDTVDFVCRNDPAVNPSRPGLLAFDITNLGIVPDRRAGTQVYIRFRQRPPLFSADAYDAARAYAIDDVCFHAPSWECYKALQATTGQAPPNATYWGKVSVPYILKRFVEQAAYAATLKPDGAADKASAELELAYAFLTQAHDEVFAQQGQVTTARATTY